MTRSILVTGASGFVGKPLSQALARSGWQVRAAARRPDAVPRADNIEAVALPDMSQPVDWSPLLDGMTHVVHLAGVAHAPGQFGEDAYGQINAAAVGELAVAARGRISRLLLMSSVRAQAGLAADAPLTEEDAPAPTDAYGRSKLEAERLLQASGTPYTILRPVVIYGPGVKGNIASLASMARTPMPLPLEGLKNRRSLLSIDNLISAVLQVLTSEDAENETYLVADKEPISVADLIAAMRTGLGRQPHLVSVPLGAVKRILTSFGRGDDWDRLSGNFVADISKLEGIGWRPEIATKEGIESMMRAEGETTRL